MANSASKFFSMLRGLRGAGRPRLDASQITHQVPLASAPGKVEIIPPQRPPRPERARGPERIMGDSPAVRPASPGRGIKGARDSIAVHDKRAGGVAAALRALHGNTGVKRDPIANSPELKAAWENLLGQPRNGAPPGERMPASTWSVSTASSTASVAESVASRDSAGRSGEAPGERPSSSWSGSTAVSATSVADSATTRDSAVHVGEAREQKVTPVKMREVRTLDIRPKGAGRGR